MRALVFDGSGLSLRADYPEPVVQGDQALLRIRKAGICNTDLEILAGYVGFTGVPGHEFVADVIAGPPDWIGQRVVGEINVADGTCDFCRRGIPSQCRHRTTVGIRQHPGAFAEYLALSVRNLHRVPDTVPDDAAVFTEPLAAATAILEAVAISPRDRVVILGAGKLGLLCAQVVRLTGAEVVVVVRREAQAALVRGWGLIAAQRDDLSEQAASIVIDCTGNAGGFADALALVEPRGTIVLKSTYVGLPAADLTTVAVRELRVIGSRCGPFPAALRLLEHGLIDTQSLIAARYPLSDGLAAVDAARQPGALKVLLEP